MLQFLSSDEVWGTLRALSRERRDRLYLAVPFLGSDGGKLLCLKRGDILIVALTEANSRNGSVCPAEIQKLQKRGVEIFLSPYLHAKVLLCGNKAVVGSANLSRTSFAHLDEAAIITNSTEVVGKIREWFRQRMIEPVTPEWLRICAKVYRPPKSRIQRNRKLKRRRMDHSVWLLELSEIDFPEDEAAVEQRGKREAQRKLSDRDRFAVSSIRWTGRPSFLNRMRRGDSIIQVMPTNRRKYAEEVARFISKIRTKSRRGTQVTYLYLECHSRPKRIPWGKFKRYCRSVGLSLPEHFGSRELLRPAQAAKILAFASRRGGL